MEFLNRQEKITSKTSTIGSEMKDRAVREVLLLFPLWAIASENLKYVGDGNTSLHYPDVPLTVMDATW